MNIDCVSIPRSRTGYHTGIVEEIVERINTTLAEPPATWSHGQHHDIADSELLAAAHATSAAILRAAHERSARIIEDAHSVAASIKADSINFLGQRALSRSTPLRNGDLR